MCDDTISKASIYFTNGECNLRTFNIAETVEKFLIISVLVGCRSAAPSSSFSFFAN